MFLNALEARQARFKLYPLNCFWIPLFVGGWQIFLRVRQRYSIKMSDADLYAKVPN